MSSDKSEVIQMKKTPPIFYAAAQVTFNPVLTMGTFVGRVQDQWRRQFPDFSIETVNQVEVNIPSEGAAPQIKTNSTARWNFKNEEGTGGYLLTSNSLVLQTTRYIGSEEFIDLLISGLKAIHEIVTLSYVEGIGFRTLDVVIPSAEKPLAFYLNAKLLGLADEVDGELNMSIYQLTKKRVFGQVVTRTIILNSQVGIPADLAPISLQFKDEVKSLNGLHAVLDNDVIQQDRFTYDPDEAARRLRIVKDGLNDVFYKSLTEEAVKEWC